jgi:hypothetical protein
MFLKLTKNVGKVSKESRVGSVWTSPGVSDETGGLTRLDPDQRKVFSSQNRFGQTQIRSKPSR